MTVIRTLPFDLPANVRFFKSVPDNHWIITQPDSMRPNGHCWEIYGDSIRYFSNTTEEEYCNDGTLGRFKYTEYTREAALGILDQNQRLPEGF